MNDFHNTSTPTARKAHRCIGCGGIIQPGERLRSADLRDKKLNRRNKMTTTQIKPKANHRLAAPQGSASPCPECAHLEISGTYKPHPLDKCKKPLRVQSVRGETTIIYGDFDSIEMARAGACGTRDAVILQREPNDQTQQPHRA